MAKGTKSTGKVIFWSIMGFIGAAALIFIIVTLILMGVHSNPNMIAEWQSWFGIVKTAPEVAPQLANGAKAALSVLCLA